MAPSPGNDLQARRQRPALPVASSGEVLAGSGNRRCLSSPVPRLDGVEPPTPPGADAAGSPVGLPRNARKSRNKRQPEPMAQLRSGTGAGSPPLDPQIRDRDPRSAHTESRLQTQSPAPCAAVHRGRGRISPTTDPAARPQISPGAVRPDSAPPPTPARPLALRTGDGCAAGSEDLQPPPRAPAHASARPVLRRFVRGRGVRPRQGVPHAGRPPALRVRARLRGAPGAPASLRLGRRHLPRRV